MFLGILNMILESSSYTQNFDCICSINLYGIRTMKYTPNISKLFHKHVERHVLLLWELLLTPSYQLSPKTRKSNVFSKNVRFCYWCWNSSACWIWCENLFRHAFLGFLWRSEGGNGLTWDTCRVFWHLFLVCLLRNLPSIASCNQPFLFGTVLVFLWGCFFSELVFFAMMGARLPVWPRSF